jgi:hypothetical protein
MKSFTNKDLFRALRRYATSSMRPLSSSETLALIAVVFSILSSVSHQTLIYQCYLPTINILVYRYRESQGEVVP